MMTDGQKLDAVSALETIRERLNPDQIAGAIQSEDPALLYRLADDLFFEASTLLQVAAHMPGHPHAVRIFPTEEAARDYLGQHWGNREDHQYSSDLYLMVNPIHDPKGWVIEITDSFCDRYYLREHGGVEEAAWMR